MYGALLPAAAGALLKHSREPTDVQGGLLHHLVVSVSSASSPASCDFGIIDPVVRDIRRRS